MKAIDMVGQRFGKLTVLKRAGSDKGRNALWLCQYDDGEKRIIQGGTLRVGSNKGKFPRHGLSHTKLHAVWRIMLDRCNNKNKKSYSCYGGRGITVCKRWHNFLNFYNDMGECPEGLTIERIDNDGNYEPSNCKWATRQEQGNNTKTNVIINYNGQRLTIAQWARKIGINYQTLLCRIRRHNWSIDRAFNQPIRKRR